MQFQAYRLEMGSRLKTPQGKSLYEYWGARLSDALNQQAEQTNSRFLLNCASQEYFGAVDLKALVPPVVTPQFMEDKSDGKGRKLSASTPRKRAARWRGSLCRTGLTDADAIKDFDIGGYAWKPDLVYAGKNPYLCVPIPPADPQAGRPSGAVPFQKRHDFPPCANGLVRK